MTDPITRNNPIAPPSLSAHSAAGGKSRSAGSQIARKTANGSPAASAVSATAPLSTSTAAQSVATNKCRLAAAIAATPSAPSKV